MKEGSLEARTRVAEPNRTVRTLVDIVIASIDTRYNTAARKTAQAKKHTDNPSILIHFSFNTGGDLSPAVETSDIHGYPCVSTDLNLGIAGELIDRQRNHHEGRGLLGVGLVGVGVGLVWGSHQLHPGWGLGLHRLGVHHHCLHGGRHLGRVHIGLGVGVF